MSTGTGMEGWNDDGGERKPLPPKRQLVQGMSRIEGMKDARKGTFVDAKEQREIGKSMEVVLLEVRTTRTLFWDKKDPKQASMKGVRCYSEDGIIPSPRLQSPVSAVCEGCDYQNKDIVARMFCYDVQDSKTAGHPVVFTYEAKSTGLSAVRNYVGSIRTQKLNARDFKFTLAVKENSNDKGEWYTADFTNVEKVPSNMRADVEAAYQSINAGGNSDGEELGAPDDVPF
jgi:hypothetical protein